MRLSRKTRAPLRNLLPVVLLAAALLSAVNAYLSISSPLSVSTVDDIVDLASATRLMNSRTRDVRHNVNVAVVVPFHRCQALSRLHKTFEFWRTHPPCTASSGPHTHISLILYYSEDLDVDSSIKRKVRSLILRLPAYIRRCFDEIHFFSARLSRKENTYPFGPCHQFYDAFPLLRNMRFSHWLLYEPDVIPTQAGWGDASLDLSSRNVNCQSWWQLGSQRTTKSSDEELSCGMSGTWPTFNSPTPGSPIQHSSRWSKKGEM